ncbi:MAG TPA: RNA-protein complex protein Nop10 [Candidatus Thermoplasmatota archaeon]|nr:RNA-protein complex protein Nop10 [Candidatus Thermoplasmatota archaeon]
MTDHLRRCPRCKEYTLQDACPVDGTATVSAKPAKYSPEDPYGSYRRKLKRLDAQESGRKQASGAGKA